MAEDFTLGREGFSQHCNAHWIGRPARLFLQLIAAPTRICATIGPRSTRANFGTSSMIRIWTKIFRAFPVLLVANEENVGMKERNDGFSRARDTSVKRHFRRQNPKTSSNERKLLRRNPTTSACTSQPSFYTHEYEYADSVVSTEEETREDLSSLCESNVEATAVNNRVDGWSECCYGMVGGCVHLSILILLISSSSCLALGCDSDTIQTPRRPNYPRTFPLPFKLQILFPRKQMDQQNSKSNLRYIRGS
jgi:hypothetical protein